jgi:hypothetical protein
MYLVSVEGYQDLLLPCDSLLMNFCLTIVALLLSIKR